MLRQKSKQTLLIEDNPGFELHVADSMSIACEKLLQRHYQVALLDMNLPDGQGLDNVHELRRDAPDLPIVVISGRYDELNY